MANQNKKKSFLSFLFKDIVSRKAKEQFFENFGLMLSSGIDVIVALGIIKNESKSRGIKSIISYIESDIQDGLPIWKSLENVRLLPIHYLSIVRVGEESGRLPENIKIVVRQMQKDREFKSKTRSASLYPSMVIILMTVVGSVVALFVLPRLTTVYKSLDVELPLITQMMIAVGDFMGQYGTIVVPAFFLFLGILYYFIFVNNTLKFIGQAILLKLPLIRKVLIEVETSRFGLLLGTLLKAGYPILDAIDLLIYSTNFARYKKFYTYLGKEIGNGLNFQQAFAGYIHIERIIPAYARQLIISAEQSGKLPDELIKLGELFEKRNESTIKDLTVVLEPLLLIVVWVGVSFIALAIILPIYNLVGNITDLSTQTGQAQDSVTSQ